MCCLLLLLLLLLLPVIIILRDVCSNGDNFLFTTIYFWKILIISSIIFIIIFRSVRDRANGCGSFCEKDEKINSTGSTVLRIWKQNKNYYSTRNTLQEYGMVVFTTAEFGTLVFWSNESI